MSNLITNKHWPEGVLDAADARLEDILCNMECGPTVYSSEEREDMLFCAIGLIQTVAHRLELCSGTYAHTEKWALTLETQARFLSDCNLASKKKVRSIIEETRKHIQKASLDIVRRV